MEAQTPTAVTLPTEMVVELSTGHITRETAKALGDEPNTIQSADLWNVLAYTPWGEFGWIIYCSEDAATNVRQVHPELANLIDICVRQRVEYLKLDSDGRHVDGLPVFDW